MKIKKKIIRIIGIIILIVLVLTGLVLVILKGTAPYTYKDGSFSYNLRTPKYSLTPISTNGSYTVGKITYLSRDFMAQKTTIYGLLLLPKIEGNVPGVVLLPGGGVSKEAEMPLAETIANWGYAVLVIDQRGVGETGGAYLLGEDDYKLLSEGHEPVQHMSVADAILAAKILRSMGGITSVGICGESMGGRYAIIATAIDREISGAVAISASGYHFPDPNSDYTRYLASTDPDSYIGTISPRPIVILQGANDTRVTEQDADATFNLANDPRRFIVEGCEHGYCAKMENELRDAFRFAFGK